jgi:hypothetical protein
MNSLTGTEGGRAMLRDLKATGQEMQTLKSCDSRVRTETAEHTRATELRAAVARQMQTDTSKLTSAPTRVFPVSIINVSDGADTVSSVSSASTAGEGGGSVPLRSTESGPVAGENEKVHENEKEHENEPDPIETGPLAPPPPPPATPIPDATECNVQAWVSTCVTPPPGTDTPPVTDNNDPVVASVTSVHSGTGVQLETLSVPVDCDEQQRDSGDGGGGDDDESMVLLDEPVAKRRRKQSNRNIK